MSLLRVLFISRHPVFPHNPCPKFYFGSIMLQPNTTSGVEVKELLFFSSLLCKIVYLVSFNAPFEFCPLYFRSPLIFVVPLQITPLNLIFCLSTDVTDIDMIFSLLVFLENQKETKLKESKLVSSP